ncbi:MAG: hypothetical protein RL235_164, partial [Chlamydiota bacterium]|jgi:MFS family permease
MAWALPLVGVTLAIAAYYDTFMGWVVLFPLLSLCGATCWVSSMAVVSNLAGKENQGKAFGVLQSFMSLALFIAPLIAGVISVYSVELPLFIGAVMLFAIGLFAIRLYRRG